MLPTLPHTARPIAFDNSFARALPAAGVRWQPAAVSAPRLLFANHALAAELGLDPAWLQGEGAAATWAGNALPAGAEPLAQAYAGHQFGGFSPQLGDGRALLVGEVIDRAGERRDIAFKGSGRTPFSRSGDGKAAVGPMLREVLIGEAMHALGIPTTRALAVVATGEPVRREQILPGAVLTRVAASHLRVGTFQYFAARGDLDTLRALIDYAVARHDPGLLGEPDRARRAFGLLRAVAARQAALVAQWTNVGFIHGVMNTDNMTISGETIDYGPCAFMEAYDPATVFSSIDHGGRYAFGNQPAIARWNLARLAEALLPAVVQDPEDKAEVEAAVAEASAAIDAFPSMYDAALRRGQALKLGLAALPETEAATIATLADDWLALLLAHRIDHTLAWHGLAAAAQGHATVLAAMFEPDAQASLDRWLTRWADLALRSEADPARRAAQLRAANPWIIPRNHQVEAALDAASGQGDLGPFEALLAALRRPFDEAPGLAPYAIPAPAEATACYQTFCGT
jgi:uncharacterized protein YdiU (UPF0061 family)